MTKILIATEAELRQAVKLDGDAIARIESALAALGKGGVVMPPILRLDLPEVNGEVDVKTAYVPGFDGFAVKISPGFFDNPKQGLPSLNGLMTLFSAKTGLPQAVLLDNGYLTDIRTAAAGAVAARHLARQDAKTAAIIGAGAQARLQLTALTLVRPLERATLWSRDPAKADAAAGELSDELGLPVIAMRSGREAVAEADIVVTTTPATEPVLMADWLRRGQHVTAIGSDAEHKNELDPTLLGRADLYVPDSLDQTRRLGELRHAEKAGMRPRRMVELGRILAGSGYGRTAPTQVTVADLTGTGVQDTAIATFALKRLRATGAGTPFES